MTKFIKKNLTKNKSKSKITSKKTEENKNKQEKILDLPEDNNETTSLTPLISKEKESKKAARKKNKKVNQKPLTTHQIGVESIKDHFYTFNLITELYTTLYTTLIFKWIQTDKILILVDQNNIGYRLEIFFKSFKINCCFLDSEMPINTNNHFANNFIKGNYQICISNKTFSSTSPNFVDKMIEDSPIPVSLIYFDFLDSNLLNDHCFRLNIRSIHHFISFDLKNNFSVVYNNLDSRITFQEYQYNKDQVSHLRYRCEDIYHSIKKSDIKKAKTKKINQELLHSKDMEKYFETHPEEKLNIVNAIKENNYYSIKASATYLPSYLIHEDTKDNKIEQAIHENYGNDPSKKKKISTSNIRRKGKSKMQEYLECLEKNDGSHVNIKF